MGKKADQYRICVDGVERDMTAEEQAIYSVPPCEPTDPVIAE